MELSDYPYRVFVSYAEEDRAVAARIVARLRELELQPVWDQDNRAGWSFFELVKRRIAHSHVFLPLLTPTSVQSTWVNHEIGFAMGRSVPVLPVSLGPLPRGMAEALHAAVADRIDDLLPLLTRERIEELVDEHRGAGVYEVADHVESRTVTIIKHYKEVKKLAFRQPQPLLHRAAFGSFTLPANPNDRELWARRYDGEPWRANDGARREALSEERRVLEEYALQYGCDLILYPALPSLTPAAVAARIEILRSFLERLHRAGARARIIFDRVALGGNTLIVGDWFCAESFTPQSDGYRHTTFTCHAPTIVDRIARFRQMFDALGDAMSPDLAIAWLDEHRTAFTAPPPAPAKNPPPD